MGSNPRKKKRRGEKVAKRVVVWGTGFVGKLVIPGILRHPAFELVGVGVSTPAKVGRDVGAFLRAGIDVCSTGVHTGEVELRGEQIGGLAVHIGARVAATGGGGDIVRRSRRTRAQGRAGKLAPLRRRGVTESRSSRRRSACRRA